MAILSWPFASLNWWSPLWTGDRHFELAICHFELAIRHFEQAIVPLSKETAGLLRPIWLPSFPCWFLCCNIFWFLCCNIFLFVFVQSSFTLVNSSSLTQHRSERWAHIKPHRVWVVMENYTWSTFHVNNHWFDATQFLLRLREVYKTVKYNHVAESRKTVYQQSNCFEVMCRIFSRGFIITSAIPVRFCQSSS